jgi:hypothetical protein
MSAAGTPRTRQLLVAAAGLAALVGAVLVLGPPPAGQPLDPDGVDPSGLRGLVEVLAALDVDVEVDEAPPAAPGPRVLVARDRLDAAGRQALLDWVEAGGTLVVADASSSLHGLATVGSDQLVGRSARPPDCDLLPEVAQVRQGDWTGLEIPAGAQHCFPIGDGDGAWLVVQARGEGQVVALGSPEPLTNARLDEADNAVLAASLLGPRPGERLRIVPPTAPPGTADDGLLDLVSDRVWWLLWLLGLALVLAVVWQARRDGPVVTEQLPPVLPSAELARSLAGLLQRTGGREDAADRLRRQARRSVRRTLTLPTGQPPEALVAAVVDRGLLAAPDARLALVPGPVPDDEALLAVASAVHRLHVALTVPARPRPTSPTP